MSTSCKGVFGIIGLPYCGSTVVSYVLGSHSQVYCGADLYKLSPNYDAGCSLHGEDCKLWTRENKNLVYESLKISQTEYYDRICQITSKSIICDASKTPSYFHSRVPDIKIPVVLINLRKHPLRHICSLLFNHHFVKDLQIRGDNEIMNYLNSRWDEALSFINMSLVRISEHSQKTNDLRQKLSDQDWLEISYENFVENPRETVSGIIGHLDLVYEEGQTKFENHDLHPIVGNTGPRRKVRQPKSPMNSNSDLRASFYDSEKSSIQMDEKYLLVFNQEQISEIIRIPEYQKLCHNLSYPLNPRGDFDEI